MQQKSLHQIKGMSRDASPFLQNSEYAFENKNRIK